MSGNKKGKRARRGLDVIDVGRKADDPIDTPTAEQTNHARYVLAEVFDNLADGGRNKLGKAYQRQPRFETIEGLPDGGYRALKRYRAAFDRSEQSATKSALDIRPRGGGQEAALLRTEAIAGATWEVDRIEAGVKPALWPTLRSVALLDKDFSAVAIERYGSREISHVDAAKPGAKVRTAIVPKSGRHRAAIREEFMMAVDQLIRAVRPLEIAERAHDVATSVVAGASVPAAAVDPAYLDDEGRMRPFDEIRAIILDRLNAGLDEAEPATISTGTGGEHDA
jgi:hypothetical protein